MGHKYDALSMATKLKVNRAVQYDSTRMESNSDLAREWKGRKREYEEWCRESWSSEEGLKRLDTYLEMMSKSGRSR